MNSIMSPVSPAVDSTPGSALTRTEKVAWALAFLGIGLAHTSAAVLLFVISNMVRFYHTWKLGPIPRFNVYAM